MARAEATGRASRNGFALGRLGIPAGMSEHFREDEGWDDPEAEEEDEDEREAQGEDPTSPARGFEDFGDLEEHDEDNY